MKNKIIKTFGIIFLAVIAIAFVSAASYELRCLQQGESINFGKTCNPSMKTLYGPTNACVHILDSGKICPALPNTCNGLGLTCSSSGGNGSGGSGDKTAPTITIQSPTNNSVNAGRKVLLDIRLSEVADLRYTDLVDGRGRWTIICGNCNSYSGERAFKEGFNYIRIEAKDRAGNIAFKDLIFYLDAQKPLIHAVDPKNGFASGNFSITYTESTVKKINITYGNGATGLRSAGLSNCGSGKKQNCSIKLDLSAYNNQAITYSFTIEDRAGNKVTTRPVKLDVDTLAPVINSFNYTIKLRNVRFLMSINEKNLESITYVDSSDLPLNGRAPTPKRMCSNLKNGICDIKLSFKTGEHDLIIYVKDKAGNIATRTASFEI
ncbi:MAG: hypothetical protein WC781_05360 [Candidatus Pacearchaeota archaeon]|jgi:hypothetical protein